MLLKKKIMIYILLMGLIYIFVQYALIPIYSVKTFFVLSLNNPTAPINDFTEIHYALRSIVARTPVALDTKGCLYIVGRKNNKVKIIVLNPKGKIERIIVPHFKDGRCLRWCLVFSVSPSGNRIWTVELDETTLLRVPRMRRITVHDHNGKGLMDWLIEGGSDTHWLINAYSEKNAYGVYYKNNLICLRFTIEKKVPQEFQLPPLFWPIFFHNGKFWWIGQHNDVTCKKRKDNENTWILATWTPEKGFRLVAKFKYPSFPKVASIQWIDRSGNLYCFIYDWDWLPHPIVNLLSKIKPLRNLLTALNIPLKSSKPVKVLVVLSQRGKVLDRIVLSSVLRPRRGENLEYGQLVKVDEKGIYLEVEKVNEPREYRIVRIVKKRRWQVWWETLRSWFSPDDI